MFGRTENGEVFLVCIMKHCSRRGSKGLEKALKRRERQRSQFYLTLGINLMGEERSLDFSACSINITSRYKGRVSGSISWRTIGR